MPSCATADGTSCKIQCESTHALHTLDSKITATCKNGGWNFGKYGSGDNKATPKFGCCEKQITSYGKAFAKSKTNRKYGFKFVEADATQALMAHQIKMKNTANAGYSFMLAFEAVVPADIVFETFARFEVVSRYDDEKRVQKIVFKFYQNIRVVRVSHIVRSLWPTVVKEELCTFYYLDPCNVHNNL